MGCFCMRRSGTGVHKGTLRVEKGILGNDKDPYREEKRTLRAERAPFRVK